MIPTSTLCFSLTLLLGGWILYSVNQVDSETLQHYQKLAQNSTLQDRIEISEKAFDGRQKRFGVHKEIWMTHPHERRVLLIQAPSSEVYISQKAGQKDYIEKLTDGYCLFQERVSPQKNTQQICSFTSHSMYYFLHNHRLECSNGYLARYNIPGTSLPSDLRTAIPYMQAVVERMKFFLDGEEIQMDLQGLKAHMEHS